MPTNGSRLDWSSPDTSPLGLCTLALPAEDQSSGDGRCRGRRGAGRGQRKSGCDGEEVAGEIWELGREGEEEKARNVAVRGCPVGDCGC